MVVDLRYSRFAKEGFELGSELIEEAKYVLDKENDPFRCGEMLVKAWIILNAASALCDEPGLRTMRAKIDSQRLRVRMMGGDLAALGYQLVTDVPDTQLAILLRQKNKEVPITPGFLVTPVTVMEGKDGQGGEGGEGGPSK